MGSHPTDGLWGAGQHVSLEIQDLGRAVTRCADGAEEVMAGFREVQLLDWESPAGRAYRDSVALQSVEVRRALDRTYEAAAAVTAHARAALTSECSPGGSF